MFYVVLILFLLVLLALAILHDKEEVVFGGVVGTIISFLTLLFVVNSGIVVYPNLMGQRAEVLSLKQEIQSVKEAYYRKGYNSKDLINLDNMKQSTNLSQYIALYAKKKAEFNSSLRKIQTLKQSLLAYLFNYTMFVSKKVMDIKPIGNIN